MQSTPITDSRRPDTRRHIQTTQHSRENKEGISFWEMKDDKIDYFLEEGDTRIAPAIEYQDALSGIPRSPPPTQVTNPEQIKHTRESKEGYGTTGSFSGRMRSRDNDSETVQHIDLPNSIQHDHHLIYSLPEWILYKH